MKEILSQALKQIAERIDAGYQRFFDAKKNKSRRRISPPTYKRVWDYRSFTENPAGKPFPSGLG
ncbi:hypothetical protein [uncultured Cloacibacillus sp.]|uniref:hypothetical protein n=1 Tax=uncultured Cloacibacillus sp. TaxID=889794 RepID=UPI0026DBFD29|nr:hypothetical protein [uncultured Cloacibacillus sp.]